VFAFGMAAIWTFSLGLFILTVPWLIWVSQGARPCMRVILLVPGLGLWAHTVKEFPLLVVVGCCCCVATRSSTASVLSHTCCDVVLWYLCPLQWNVRDNHGLPPFLYRWMKKYRGW
jgi:hypothetical protein